MEKIKDQIPKLKDGESYIVPAMEKTAMQELIESINSLGGWYHVYDKEQLVTYIESKATELLTKEREQIEAAVNMTHGTQKTGEDYYNTNYKK